VRWHVVLSYFRSVGKSLLLSSKFHRRAAIELTARWSVISDNRMHGCMHANQGGSSQLKVSIESFFTNAL
jgi:hypothetical protein